MTIYYAPGESPPVFVPEADSDGGAEEALLESTDDGWDELLLEGPFDEALVAEAHRQARRQETSLGRSDRAA